MAMVTMTTVTSLLLLLSFLPPFFLLFPSFPAFFFLPPSLSLSPLLPSLSSHPLLFCPLSPHIHSPHSLSSTPFLHFPFPALLFPPSRTLPRFKLSYMWSSCRFCSEWTMLVVSSVGVCPCVEWFHGSVHGRSGESRRRCTLSASEFRQPNACYRGRYYTLLFYFLILIRNNNSCCLLVGSKLAKLGFNRILDSLSSAFGNNSAER